MNPIDQYPVLVSNLVTLVMGALATWLTARGISASGQQQIASFVGSAATVLIAALVARLGHSKATPVANPKAADGSPLVVQAPVAPPA